MNRLFAILSFTLAVVAHATVPEAIVQEAQSLRPGIVEAVSGDADLMKDAGLTGKKVDLQYRFEDAFLMHRIDPSRVDSAGSLGEAVVQDGVYYVPLCTGGRCPLMASFRAGENGAEFLSVGHPNAAARLEAATRELGGERARIVDYPESQTSFLLVQRNGEEVLVPQSAQEDGRLRQLLGGSVGGGATAGKNGRLQLKLAQVKRLAERVRAQHAGEADGGGTAAEKTGASTPEVLATAGKSEPTAAETTAAATAIAALATTSPAPALVAETDAVLDVAPTEESDGDGTAGLVVLGAALAAGLFAAMRRRARR